ncbi:hypothetical protein [Streptomyces europaeiscabiei]|uniref:hypothetical protein n=1 Tax=Streptomyces europaeiscabiei TaxID=146819 RepID=UPI002E137EF8|nr:hypothetical protein OHB30_04040 [Streptomyces europaeiscabiei]
MAEQVGRVVVVGCEQSDGLVQDIERDPFGFVASELAALRALPRRLWRIRPSGPLSVNPQPGASSRTAGEEAVFKAIRLDHSSDS